MSKHDWTYKKLGDVCVSDLGKTLNQSKDKGEMRPYLCAINILWDKIDLTTLKETRFEENELERYSILKGDLLVCEGGDIGRAAIWEGDYPIQYQNALHRMRFKPSMTPRFCLYYLYHLKTTGELDAKYGKGVTIKHLVKSSLLSIPTPIPPMREQESIVTELDEINEAIAELQQQIVDLDTLSQSTFYDMFGDPVTNPKGWEVKKLGELSTVKTGPFGSMLHKEDYIENGIPLVNPIHMKNYKIVPDMSFTISEEKAEQLSNYLLETNDIVFARRGDIGRCAVVSSEQKGFLCGTGSLFVRFTEDVNSIFTLYIIRSESFANNLISSAKGATMLNINSSIVEDLDFILPSLALQQEFASRVEAIEVAKAELNVQIAEMQTLLASRMDYYFD